jgi:hypothetical protein
MGGCRYQLAKNRGLLGHSTTSFSEKRPSNQEKWRFFLTQRIAGFLLDPTPLSLWSTPPALQFPLV